MTGARLIKRRSVPPWAVTFADMMALLVALFVMMLSFSEMNLQRYKQIVVSMQESFTPDAFVRQVLVIVDPSAVPDGVEVVILDVDAQIPTTPSEEETTEPPEEALPQEQAGESPTVQLLKRVMADELAASVIFITAEGRRVPGARSVASEPAAATAARPIGRVETATGPVTATRIDGTRVTLTAGEAVFQGDVLETGSGAALGVLFGDGTTFSLGENGRMALDQLIYDPESGEGTASYSVVQGVFSFVSGAISKSGPDQMVVQMPVATIGIRGASAAGLTAPEGARNIVVLLAEENDFVGEISVTTDAGSVVLNIANQSVEIFSRAEAPSRPISLSDQEITLLFGAALDALPPSPATADEVLEELEQDAEAAPEIREAQADSPGGPLVIRFSPDVAFDPGRHELKQSFLPTLDKLARVLTVAPGQIIVAGHTDDVPIATTRYRSNWDLSTARAVSVVQRLLEHGTINPARVSAQGYADSRPLVPNNSQENRAINRRVEISIEQQ